MSVDGLSSQEMALLTYENKTLEKDVKENTSQTKTKVEKILHVDLNHSFWDYLLKELDKVIVGQEKAKKTIVNTIVSKIISKRSKKGPMGTLFFAGPTWVWKTEIVKALANILFGDENAFTKISCDTYQESHTARTLFWAPKSYIWYGDKTPLHHDNLFRHFDTAKQRGKLNHRIKQIDGFNIILFDEIEKAHQNVHQNLLNLLSDAKVEFPDGKVTKYHHSLIIFTSNIGQKEIAQLESKNSIGFATEALEDKQKDKKNILQKQMKEVFSPEFLNRINKVVEFEEITKENCREIISMHVKMINESYAQTFIHSDLTLKIDDSIYDYVIDRWYSSEKWAREIIRVFEEQIELQVDIILDSKEFAPYFHLDTPVTLEISMWKNDKIIPRVVYFQWENQDEKLSEDEIVNEFLPAIFKETSWEYIPSMTVEKLNYIFGLVSQYVEMYHVSLDGQIDFKKEIQDLEAKLWYIGFSTEDIRLMRNRAYIEELRNLSYIDDFRGITIRDDKEIFSPYPMKIIDKIIKYKFESLAKEDSYSKYSYEDISMIVLDYTLEVVSNLFGWREINQEQISQIIILVKKEYTHRFC